LVEKIKRLVEKVVSEMVDSAVDMFYFKESDKHILQYESLMWSEKLIYISTCNDKVFSYSELV